MKAVFTLCSNNYLAQALVLAQSVLMHEPSRKFFIGLVDQKDPTIYYDRFPCEVIEAGTIEPQMLRLAQKYSIVELNTCVKATFFQYLFDTAKADEVIYLDPDTCLFGPMRELDKRLLASDFVITPHILSHIPLDNRSPQENLFLNYGVYNLGFLAIRRSEQMPRFLEWWKERLYEKGYDRPAEGLFTDQLWINLLPVLFHNVHVLRHPGYNMAPWNLHERRIVETGSGLGLGPGIPLVFYHFSGFHPAKRKFHKDYNRYAWNDRPDLHAIYEAYASRLNEEGYDIYSAFASHYAAIRKMFIRDQERRKQRNGSAGQNSYPKKMIRQVKRMLPGRLKRKVLDLLNA